MLGRIAHKLRTLFYQPSIRIDHAPNVLRLGSKGYGEWAFLDGEALRGSTIVSVGLGEDATFDVEFAARYGAKVVMVDPTPRAIAHFRQIQARLGQPATMAYRLGSQPAEAYDLRALDSNSLTLVEKALWIDGKPVKFFQPANEKHVSHSITQHQDTPFIEVPSVTPRFLVEQFGSALLTLWKLDIEGAEIGVLDSMLDDGILPDQILVEYDVCVVPSRESKETCEATDRRLRQAGYRCVYVEGRNYSYARSHP
jgi:FkbM family methyltransferase